MSKPHSESVLDIVRQFEQTKQGEYDIRDLGTYMLTRGYEPPLRTRLDAIIREVSSIMRSAKFVGPRKTKVRRKHCVKRKLDDGQMQFVWCDIDVATPQFMELSFSQRRDGLVSKAFQLHNDVVYWNDEKNNGSPVDVLFDFRDDIADRLAGTDLEDMDEDDEI